MSLYLLPEPTCPKETRSNGTVIEMGRGLWGSPYPTLHRKSDDEGGDHWVNKTFRPALALLKAVGATFPVVRCLFGGM